MEDNQLIKKICNISHQRADIEIPENSTKRQSVRLRNKHLTLCTSPKKEVNDSNKKFEREHSHVTRKFSGKFANEASLIAYPESILQTNDFIKTPYDSDKNIVEDKIQQECPVKIETGGITNNNQDSDEDAQIINDDFCIIKQDKEKNTNEKEEVINQELFEIQLQTKSTENANITIDHESDIQTKGEYFFNGTTEVDGDEIRDGETQDENTANIKIQSNSFTDKSKTNTNLHSKTKRKRKRDELSLLEIDRDEITERKGIQEKYNVKGIRKSFRFTNKTRVTYHHSSEINKKDDKEDSDVEFDIGEIKKIAPPVEMKTKSAEKVNNRTNDKKTKIQNTDKDDFTDTDLSTDGMSDSEETILEPKNKRRHESHAIITDNEEINEETVVNYSIPITFDVEKMEGMAANESSRIPKKYLCVLCRIKFINKADLRRHKTFKHMSQFKGPYTCTECSTSVSSYNQLRAHWEGSHNQAYKCTLCDYVARHYFLMNEHILGKHHSVYTCRVCNAVFFARLQFSNHHKEFHTRLICDYCSKGYTNKDKLTFHIQYRHCVKCGKAFKNSRSRKSHYNRHHPDFPYNSGENLELAYCVECDKQYGSVYQYKVHLKTSKVHNNKPLKKVDRTHKRRQCPVCDKVYANQKLLQQHYDIIHTGKSKFQCKICNKYLFSSYGLHRHMERIHEKLPLLKTKICDICGRPFHAESTLINHRRTHTGERPYACVVCPAAFAQKTSLVLHMRKTHNVQDFTYKSVANVK